ncbi:MAG: hypoxanthine phosphoribosyltransferase, partial [Bacteroidota bacterium]
MQTVTLHDKSFDIFISEQIIQESIAVVAQQINADYHGKNPLFIGILNGSFLFVCDLFGLIEGQPEISVLKISSEAGKSSNGRIKYLFVLK